jgi:hypothetical protein
VLQNSRVFRLQAFWSLKKGQINRWGMELVAWVWEQCEDFGSTVVGQQARPAGFVTRPALRHDQGIFNVTRRMFKKFELNLQDKWWTWMHTFIAMAMKFLYLYHCWEAFEIEPLL